MCRYPIFNAYETARCVILPGCEWYTQRPSMGTSTPLLSLIRLYSKYHINAIVCLRHLYIVKCHFLLSVKNILRQLRYIRALKNTKVIKMHHVLSNEASNVFGKDNVLPSE